MARVASLHAKAKYGPCRILPPMFTKRNILEHGLSVRVQVADLPVVFTLGSIVALLSNRYYVTLAQIWIKIYSNFSQKNLAKKLKTLEF